LSPIRRSFSRFSRDLARLYDELEDESFDLNRGLAPLVIAIAVLAVVVAVVRVLGLMHLLHYWHQLHPVLPTRG
jgi:hypothetical protein